ncbi:hypothetical protein [Sciscionella marina]|uniref:hypothetical protein n=1 Tax=Sciscionella marina TaxID=508770 RepID=UPI000370446E|nr:hypothetical protein [Sciscionella marina]
MNRQARTAHTARWWQQAARAHAQLSAGIRPDTTWSSFTMDPGEVAFGNLMIQDIDYSRLIVPNPVHYHQPGRLVVGSPQFVTGALLGSMAAGMLGRRRARKMSQPYWEDPVGAMVTITDRRLYCDAWGTALRFDYAATTGVDPNLGCSQVTLSFANTTPLRLTGPAAVLVAVFASHHVHGPAAASMPQLAALRQVPVAVGVR